MWKHTASELFLRELISSHSLWRCFLDLPSPGNYPHGVRSINRLFESLTPLYTTLHSCLPKLPPGLSGCFSAFWLRPRADFCVLAHQVGSYFGKIFVFMEESSWYLFTQFYSWEIREAKLHLLVRNVPILDS